MLNLSFDKHSRDSQESNLSLSEAAQKATKASKQEGDYDPHDKRDIKYAITNNEAKVHLIKSAFGTSCLAMPYRFQKMGYMNGLILTLLLFIIVQYALHKLIRSIYTLCKRHRLPHLSFSKSMELALLEGPKVFHIFSKAAGLFVMIILPLYHFGICSIYIVFISSTLKHIIQQENPEWEHLDVRWYIIFLIVPLLFIFSLRKLKNLVPLSLFANLMLIIAFTLIIFPILFSLPSLQERTAFKSLEHFLLLYGTVIFSIQSVGVILAIESHLSTPRDFLGIYGVLNQGQFVVIVIFMAMGFFGSWMYGEQTEASIADNLEDTVFNNIVEIVIAISIFFTYSLQGYIIVDIIWHQHFSKGVDEKHRVCFEYILRFALVLGTAAFAIILPHFSLILPFFGSLCISILGFIFPGLIDVCTRYQDGYGAFRVHLIVDIFLILLGLFGGAAGTYKSIKEELLSKPNI